MTEEPNAVVINPFWETWEVWSGGIRGANDVHGRNMKRGTFLIRKDAEKFAKDINGEDTE